jgi:hypothetical protein
MKTQTPFIILNFGDVEENLLATRKFDQEFALGG